MVSPWQGSGISPNPTPLVKAILSNNREEILSILDTGASPNQISSDTADQFGNPLQVLPPLSWAVSGLIVCDTLVLKMLIDHGADVNGLDSLLASRSELPYSPINVAILHGETVATEFLLRHGANPNIFDPPKVWFGLSPLIGAIFNRDVQLGRTGQLLDQNKFGDTSSAHRMRVYDTIITYLLKYGASPSLAEPSGKTPLHAAAEYCDSALAEELIARGASIEAKDNQGNTPEDLAKKNCPAVLAVIQRHKNSTK